VPATPALICCRTWPARPGSRGSHRAALTLVDPEIYEPANLTVQNIESLDTGEPKVVAQAGKLRRINPSLDVAALQERIEDVPWGLCGAT